MSVLHVDCVGGASGDMLLGALADLGAEDAIKSAVEALALPGCTVSFKPVKKNGFAACQAVVEVPAQSSHRHVPDLLSVLDKSRLPATIRERAKSVVHRLAETEASVHGHPLEKLHLHELGGDDTLIDITGFLAGLESLDVDHVTVSAFPVGSGFIQSAHGPLPLPAPATLALLKGAPLRPVNAEGEFVTPTGAVLLTSVARSFGACPPMTLTAIGQGAGQKDFVFPNLVRLWLGEGTVNEGLMSEQLCSLESNIDDCNPQLLGHLLDRLLSLGALDVTFIPQQMKKDRPGTLLTVLYRPELESRVLDAIFRETTTIGVRRQVVDRFSLPRREETIQTDYGPIRMKIVEWKGIERATPEYEDCKEAAEKCVVPVFKVIEACLRLR